MKLTERMNIVKVWIFQKLQMEDGIYYVCNGDTLPFPLDAAEEQHYLDLLSGDAEEAEQARAVLIERNLRLVVYIARKFENTGIPIEDLISIGTIGLIKAVNTFDGSKKIKLATYASRCIENEILMYKPKEKVKVASTVKNAYPHLKKNMILKLDIRHFFDHIIYPMVKEKVFVKEKSAKFGLFSHILTIFLY